MICLWSIVKCEICINRGHGKMEHLWTQMMILFCFRLMEEVNGLMNELNNFFK